MKHLKLFRLLAFSAFLLTQHSLRAQDVPIVPADTLSADTTWKQPSWSFEVELGSYLTSDALSFDEPSSPNPAVGFVLSCQQQHMNLTMYFRTQSESESYSRSGLFGSSSYHISPARSFTEVGMMVGMVGPLSSLLEARLNGGLAYSSYTMRGKLISDASHSTGWLFSSDSYTDKVYEAKESESLALVVDASLALKVSKTVSLGLRLDFSQSFDAYNCAMMMVFSRFYL